MINFRKRPLAQVILIYVLYFLVFIFFIMPILYIIALSLKDSKEIFSAANIFNFFPKKLAFENYVRVMKTVRMDVYLLNSAKLVVVTVLGSLLISSLSAFALSRFKSPKKNIMLMGILFFQMISPIIISIPIYWYYSKLGLLDTFFGISFIYIAVQIPFTTYLLKGVFDAIPVDLDEAAKIDGCNRIQTLFKVIIPPAIPGIASATIFISINAWSQFILPFFLISDSKLYPVSVGILLAQGTFREITTHYVAAASVIGLLPAVILVLFLQKLIVRALVSGAVKG